jgi:hypothetical protein
MKRSSVSPTLEAFAAPEWGCKKYLIDLSPKMETTSYRTTLVPASFRIPRS